MKNFILLLTLILSVNCCSQNKIISISPLVNQENDFNQSIINTLEQFLKTKDPKFWLQSDFQKYSSPYYEILEIEAGTQGKDFYKPSLMEIISTDDPDKKIVKIAFIGHNAENKSNLIKAIYNVVANKVGNQIFFSKYLDFVTKDWKIIQAKNIKYYISPSKLANTVEIEKQRNEVEMLSAFFELKPFPIFYYSAISPKETFELKGFDYHPMMYIDKAGGFAEGKDIIISGNNSEYYTHEVVHLYTTRLFPDINYFLDEGIATYFGGSGKFNYDWQKEKLRKFISENPDFKFDEHLDVYERLYFEEETPIPYVAAALICERTIRLYGKEKLFEAFRSRKEILEVLETIGLTKGNINQELRKELNIN